MEDLIEMIEELKKEKNAVILAHYYVREEIQAIADYIGDSYYLSKIATEIEEEIIVFCGVSFMGESAKLLNPRKKVFMPVDKADCPMAHMADVDKILQVRQEYPQVAVVCYVNSTAELKAHSDVCVTSSNAVSIVGRLPQKDIYFIPDENLGRYVAKALPDKHFIFNDGFCHVHTSISRENLLKAKAAKPDAKVLVHPECTQDVIELADYVGSTSGIIDFAAKSTAKELIIGTEVGVFYELQKKNPDKRFYSIGHRQYCPNMKRITLESIRDVLISEGASGVEVILDQDILSKASRPLERMLELASLANKC